MIVVADEVSNLLYEITGQTIALKQDAVFEGLMPPLDFALGLGMHGCATRVVHDFVAQPVCQWRRQIVPGGGVNVYQSG